MEQMELLVRINKYLADKKYCTRKEADLLIKEGRMKINGHRARLGDKVSKTDTVEVRQAQKTYSYVAYHKPRGVITHSPQLGEQDIAKASGLRDLFPVGRLDKDSSGLIILTNDGRLIEALLNPAHGHEKEYMVSVREKLPNNFKRLMERGIDIGGYRTKQCKIMIRGERIFSITLTEGKKHQIRRMCDALGVVVVDLKRVRIMNIKLGNLSKNGHHTLAGTELRTFLASVGL